MKSFSTPLLLAAATLAAASSVHAADIIDINWLGVTANWTTATNWSGSNVPNDSTTERAVFDGNVGTNAVTYANFGPGNYVSGILVKAGQTTGLSINSEATGGIFRLGGGTGIEIESGAGAFSFGTGATTSQIFAGNGGTLTFNNNSANTATIGTGVQLYGNTTGTVMRFTGSGNWAVDSLIGSGTTNVSLLKDGDGTLTLSHANTYAGTTTINAGTLEIGDSGTLGAGSYAGAITNAGTLLVSTSANQTLSGAISGAGALTKSGAGTLTLSVANSYAGGTAINGGILAISKNNSLGSGGVTFDGGTLRVNNAALTSGTATLANTLSVATGKTGVIDLVGTGAAGNDLTLNTGAITVDGTLKITRMTGGRGTTNVGSLFSGSGVLEVGDTNAGSTIGSGSNGAGRLWVRNDNAFASFTGSVHILNNGNLALFGTTVSGVNGQLVNGNDVTIDAGGYLSLRGNLTSTIGNLNGAGTIVRNSNASAGPTATLKVAGGNFTGKIDQTGLSGGNASNTISIEKIGSGTLTLSGANTHSGATTISGGTLLANNTTGSATGTGAVSVAAGARLGGSGTVSSAVTVAGGVTGGTIRGGTGTVATDALSIGGKVTLASGSIVELALGSGGAHSSLNFNGTGDVLTSGLVFSFLDLGATTGTYTGLITGVDTAANLTGWSIANAGWVGTFSQDGTNINLNLTAVPEPSTYGLIGAGALAAVAMVRRRRKHAGAVAA